MFLVFGFRTPSLQIIKWVNYFNVFFANYTFTNSMTNHWIQVNWEY